jgi:acyl-CoA dehydrogenase
VLPIWEGTTNVLSLDVLRALSRGDGVEPLLGRLAAGAQLADGALGGDALGGGGEAGLFAGYLADMREQVTLAAKDPGGDRVQAGARGLALRLGNALSAALLVEHAAWAQATGTDPGAVPAARLWIRERLAGQDVADAAHRYTEIL